MADRFPRLYTAWLWFLLIFVCVPIGLFLLYVVIGLVVMFYATAIASSPTVWGWAFLVAMTLGPAGAALWFFAGAKGAWRLVSVGSGLMILAAVLAVSAALLSGELDSVGGGGSSYSSPDDVPEECYPDLRTTC